MRIHLAAALAVAAVSASTSTQAAVIIQFLQDGANVTVTASGTFDQTGLTFVAGGAKGSTSNLTASTGIFSIGPSGSINTYSGLTGPAAFGTGSFTNTATTSGSAFQISGSQGRVSLPSPFTSGGPISSAAVFANRTLANLGLTTGQYVYTAPFDTITVNVGPFATVPGAVPEPAAWAMMIGGFGMVGGALRSARRNRKPALA